MKKLLKKGKILSIVFNDSDLVGSIDSVICRLQEVQKTAESMGFNNICLDIFSYEGINVEITGDRYETDVEVKKRLLKSKKIEQNKIDREYKEYNRLKAKFGK